MPLPKLNATDQPAPIGRNPWITLDTTQGVLRCSRCTGSEFVDPCTPYRVVVDQVHGFDLRHSVCVEAA